VYGRPVRRRGQTVRGSQADNPRVTGGQSTGHRRTVHGSQADSSNYSPEPPVCTRRKWIVQASTTDGPSIADSPATPCGQFVKLLPTKNSEQKRSKERRLRTHEELDCRCLNLSTSMGGTRSEVEGGHLHDLEPEGTHEDTRHEIYTGSSSRSSYPTSCLG
jgi:hypothetical protein